MPVAIPVSRHHTTRVLRRLSGDPGPGRAEGVWEVARPIRDTSWWHQWRRERACRKTTGHCWHPEALIDWWCCMCSADTDGAPKQSCIHCTREPSGVR